MNIEPRTAYLINSIINCAAVSNSEFPMQAINARRKLEVFRTELLEHISRLENPTVELFVESCID